MLASSQRFSSSLYPCGQWVQSFAEDKLRATWCLLRFTPWFYSYGAILNDQNGGFTVFGRVVGDRMNVVGAIANLSRFNLTENFGSAFGGVPLIDDTLEVSNFVALVDAQRQFPELPSAVFLDRGADFFSFTYSDGTLLIEVLPEASADDYRVEIEGTTLCGRSPTVERSLRIGAAVPTVQYDGAIEVGEGWLYLNWLKEFKPVANNWMYHARHGWLYSAAEDTDDMFLYDLGLSRWMFTREGLYPWLYPFGPGGGWF